MADKARQAVKELLTDRKVGRGSEARRIDQVEIIIRQGQFDFGELLRWKNRLKGMLALNDIVFLDVDEAKNRIRIGIEPGADHESVMGLVERAKVPLEAVIVSEVESVQPMVTLRDKVRPTAGGLQIAFSNYLCTLGFNNYRSSTLGFATNSHCTEVKGGVERTDYGQPYLADHIGVEYADPQYWVGGGCPSGRRCRWSDSALAYYDASISVDFGKIARTTYWGRSSGSITIYDNNPRMNIVGEEPWPLLGDMLDKIGRTTGWTYGWVQWTCVDTNVADSDTTLLCQDFVDAGVGGGDSGSPVFLWQGDDVTLYGLLWGGTSTSFIFSAMANIQYELGELLTH